MSAHARTRPRLTVEAFLAWADATFGMRQREDGGPVAMAASDVRAVLQSNLAGPLCAQLRAVRPACGARAAAGRPAAPLWQLAGAYTGTVIGNV